MLLIITALIAPPALADIMIRGLNQSDMSGKIGTNTFSALGVPITFSPKDVAAINSGTVGFDLDVFYNDTAGRKVKTKHISFLKTGLQERALSLATNTTSDELPALTQAANTNPTGGSASAAADLH